MWDVFEPRRAGMLLWAFEPGMGFEHYVAWAAGAPLTFVYHKHTFVPVTSGASFSDFMRGRLPELPGALRAV
jgi:glutamate--cysteine ligase